MGQNWLHSLARRAICNLRRHVDNIGIEHRSSSSRPVEPLDNVIVDLRLGALNLDLGHQMGSLTVSKDFQAVLLCISEIILLAFLSIDR